MATNSVSILMSDCHFQDILTSLKKLSAQLQNTESTLADALLWFSVTKEEIQEFEPK